MLPQDLPQPADSTGRAKNHQPAAGIMPIATVVPRLGGWKKPADQGDWSTCGEFMADG
jgi:hypothetical protein